MYQLLRPSKKQTKKKFPIRFLKNGGWAGLYFIFITSAKKVMFWQRLFVVCGFVSEITGQILMNLSGNVRNGMRKN